MGLFPLKQTKMGVGGWDHHLPVTQRMWCLITWGDRWRKRTILNTIMAQGLALWTELLEALSHFPTMSFFFFSTSSFSESCSLSCCPISGCQHWLTQHHFCSLHQNWLCWMQKCSLAVNALMMCEAGPKWALPSCPACCHSPILVPLVPRCCCSFKVLPVSASSSTINIEIIFCICSTSCAVW